MVHVCDNFHLSHETRQPPPEWRWLFKWLKISSLKKECIFLNSTTFNGVLRLTSPRQSGDGVLSENLTTHRGWYLLELYTFHWRLETHRTPRVKMVPWWIEDFITQRRRHLSYWFHYRGHLSVIFAIHCLSSHSAKLISMIRMEIFLGT